MIAQSSFNNPNFKLVAKGLVDLHRLDRAGKDDSPEAESIRDALDAPLDALSQAERERAQWLSEDLYSVSDPPGNTTQKEMNPQAQQKFEEAVEARNKLEWDKALKLLRGLRECIPPTQLSGMRGSIWRAIGNFDVAAAFYGHASETDPDNHNCTSLHMIVLAESDPDTARTIARDVLADPETYDPMAVLKAADICVKETKSEPTAEVANLFRQLIPILDGNLARIEQTHNLSALVSAHAMTVFLLGLCHEFFGNVDAAVDGYTRGLQVNPNDDALLVARGILEYGTNSRAVADFEKAVCLNSPLIFPYLFFAHSCLTAGRVEECRDMCEQGLTKDGSNEAMSKLKEWQAIALAELGFPAESVLEAFDAAIRLDPSNDLAKFNRAMFESSQGHQNALLNWKQDPPAAVRQFGIDERRHSVAA